MSLKRYAFYYGFNYAVIQLYMYNIAMRKYDCGVLKYNNQKGVKQEMHYILTVKNSLMYNAHIFACMYVFMHIYARKIIEYA